ncbi:MAG: hypothetical protein L0Z62_09525 [Gemmataceae bacterium]|nr:hypothetical protein [Gemmataceae bacterium]
MVVVAHDRQAGIALLAEPEVNLLLLVVSVLELIDEQGAQVVGDRRELPSPQHVKDELLQPGEVREVVVLKIRAVVRDRITEHLPAGPASGVGGDVDVIVPYAVSEGHDELKHVGQRKGVAQPGTQRDDMVAQVGVRMASVSEDTMPAQQALGEESLDGRRGDLSRSPAVPEELLRQGVQGADRDRVDVDVA